MFYGLPKDVSMVPEEEHSGVRALVQILPLPLVTCVTMGELLKLSGLHFPHSDFKMLKKSRYLRLFTNSNVSENNSPKA